MEHGHSGVFGAAALIIVLKFAFAEETVQTQLLRITERIALVQIQKQKSATRLHHKR